MKYLFAMESGKYEISDDIEAYSTPSAIAWLVKYQTNEQSPLSSVVYNATKYLSKKEIIELYNALNLNNTKIKEIYIVSELGGNI